MLSRGDLEEALGERFHLGENVANGRRSSVYEARDGDRAVVVKVARAASAESHESLRLACLRALRLSHPNNLGLLHVKTARTRETGEPRLVLVSEKARGMPLSKQIRAIGAFSEARALGITVQLLRALKEAHSIALIHGSLHPANIFLGTEGDDTDVVRVLDYGAHHLASEHPRYFTPEHAKGEALDERSDVYGVGLLLYEMLSGRSPFGSSSGERAINAHKTETPPPLRRPSGRRLDNERLETFVQSCLAKRPSDRPSSAEEARARLVSAVSAYA